MNEFSFYTKTALNLDNLATLVEAVQAMASQYHNVHLLLSSFAVIDDLRILNISYMYSGADPKW